MTMMNDNRSRTVAVLHDVVESGKISIKELTALGFDKKVCRAVDLLSRKKNEKYIDYIDRLKGNKIAKKVKLADLMDNYSRRVNYASLSKVDVQKIKKYKKAYKRLTGKKLPNKTLIIRSHSISII
ncbi:MAG: hypothetical protein Ct9H90mP7_0930 [Candidatus Neomarinimicrobiota bacterium]|nr:MAG: hypothetical protein Ct9H90mP7_0930 [Candidatus Neomarinimicrobiota bacterium]